MSVEFADILEYLNPIREFLESASVSEIIINADLGVFVEERGRKREASGCRLSRADVNAAVKRIARAADTEPSESNPIINVRLGDGASRICMVLPPASPDGVTISIRKFRPIAFYGRGIDRAGNAATRSVRGACGCDCSERKHSDRGWVWNWQDDVAERAGSRDPTE